jgi:phospholipid-binding lipoprotein MlaA
MVVLALITLAGCATAPTTADNPDPLEPANRTFYSINESLDKAILKPVAETYAEYTPQLVRDGVTNFFNNLTYLNVILNTFLQGKFDQGMADTLRFLYNSTFGLGGLIDVSTPIGMPAHDEDFGQTLAVWGGSEGTYLYLPLHGPDSTGNLPDLATSTLLNPLTYVTGAVLFPLSALNIINKRANLLEATNIRDEAAVDPYIFTREAYVQRRQYLIHDGNPPVEGYEDIFDNGDGDDASGEEGDAGVLRIE